jgi:hypothetical protein
MSDRYLRYSMTDEVRLGWQKLSELADEHPKDLRVETIKLLDGQVVLNVHLLSQRAEDRQRFEGYVRHVLAQT